MSSPTLRLGARALALGIVSLVLAAVPALVSTPAAHADTYRFWSYWQAKGDAWTLATKGPGGTQPADGTVEGWRFTKSSGDAGQAAEPRHQPVFGQICSDTPEQADTKRVGVVIDYGTAKDTARGGVPPVPRAACARVAPDATGKEILAAVTEERFADSGLVCAIDGYPRGGCDGTASGETSGDGSGGSAGAEQTPPVNDATESPATSDTPSGRSGDESGAAADPESAADGGLPLGAVIGAAAGGLLIGVLGGAAVLRARRSN